MKIKLNNAGRRIKRDWIFRGILLQIEDDTCIGIAGPNGAGKSTLLRCISGQLTLTEGSVSYFSSNAKEVAIEEVYKHFSYCAPYIELIEEFTLAELLDFVSSFKSWRAGWNKESSLARFPYNVNTKLISQYSSGMKQRARLLLGFAFASEILFIDEPTTNLDTAGVVWYEALLSELLGQSTIIIASNDASDFKHCSSKINLLDFSSVY